LVDTTPSPK
ncbi:hypothetical protein D030_3444B, partial [Vibrio parahaemolyticus AQ3810]